MQIRDAWYSTPAGRVYVAEVTTGDTTGVASGLLPVFPAMECAKQHGDLGTEAFQSGVRALATLRAQHPSA